MSFDYIGNSNHKNHINNYNDLFIERALRVYVK